jgi:hypothetical protein
MKNDQSEVEGTLLWMYHQSYLGEINERPKNLDSLVFLVNVLRRLKGKDYEHSETGEASPTREYLYIEFLTDALEKLGFVYLARDQLKKNIKDIHVSKYHIYNLIFDCKAFLDTMAGLLNHHYEMGKKGTSINLCHSEFRKELGKNNPELFAPVKEFENWIIKLGEWRNKLIHRQGIFIPFTDGGAEYMLEEPWNFTELAGHLKKGPPCHIKTIEFCEGNSKFAFLFMEIVCAAIRNDLMDKNSTE